MEGGWVNDQVSIMQLTIGSCLACIPRAMDVSARFLHTREVCELASATLAS